MNIKDVNEAEGVDNELEAIFQKQRELMDKYHHIEKESGLMQTEDVPVNLHCKFGQARLKDFAWRAVEEIGEATAALKDHPEEVDHFNEEMIDALHFLVELCIISGLTYEDIGPRIEDTKTGVCALNGIEGLVYPIIEELTRAMNCLKQKPWKQTHILTDEKRFKGYIIHTMHLFFSCLSSLSLAPEDIYNYYFKKNEVNKFRQRSNY